VCKENTTFLVHTHTQSIYNYMIVLSFQHQWMRQAIAQCVRHVHHATCSRSHQTVLVTSLLWTIWNCAPMLSPFQIYKNARVTVILSHPIVTWCEDSPTNATVVSPPA